MKPKRAVRQVGRMTARPYGQLAERRFRLAILNTPHRVAQMLRYGLYWRRQVWAWLQRPRSHRVI